MPKVNMTQCERQAVARIVRQAIDPALAGILVPTDTCFPLGVLDWRGAAKGFDLRPIDTH